MRGGVPLHVAVMDSDHAGKENGKKGNEQKGKSKYVLMGEVTHRWQPYSASESRIVNSLL